MASAPPLAPPDELTPFPPELIALILKHSLPSPSTTHNFASRAALLRPISLLSRAWRDFAQSQLFEHAVVRVDAVGRGGVSTGAGLLLRTVQESERCKEMIKSLYIGRTLEGVGDHSRWRASGVKELLDEMGHLRTLGLESLFQFNLSWLNALTQLDALSLHNVEGRITDRIALSHLTSLSLSHCELWEEDWHTLISQDTLPSLRSLGIYGNPRLSALLAPLPPSYIDQLEALYTNPLAERNWTGTTSGGTTKIQAPVLWECLSHHSLQGLFIEERDVPVKHIRCRGWHAHAQLRVLADLLAVNSNAVDRENVTRAVEGLESLYIDRDEVYSHEARTELDRVLSACKAAKIEVVREGDGDQKASLVSEQFWRRAREQRAREEVGEEGGATTAGAEVAPASSD